MKEQSTESLVGLRQQARKLRPAIFDGLNAVFSDDQWDVIERGMTYFAELQWQAASEINQEAHLRAGMTEKAHARVRKTIDTLGKCSDEWKDRYEAAEKQL